MIRVAFATLALALVVGTAPIRAAARPFVAVLVWHDIVSAKSVYFDTTVADFSAQLDEIARGGFHVIPLRTLQAYLAHRGTLPTRPLVLTFDDNGAGIYAHAFPLLRAHRFPATLFVHTNYVGKTTSKHHTDWDGLRAMIASGLIDVESLTANHPPDLTKLSDEDVLHEFRLSKFSLEHRLGRPVFAVAYPYDVYDVRVERLAERAGYSLGVTEDHGNAADSASPFEVHRYSVTAERFEEALDNVRVAY